MKQSKPDIGKFAPSAPAAWSVILAESEAEQASGLVVSGDDILRELRDSLDRLDKPAELARTRAIHRAG